MDKRKRAVPLPVGAGSLLAIFAVLCLTVFALLSLSTVQANVRLQEASSAAVTGYYRADCQAEEILARLRAGELPPGVTEDSRSIYHYTCPISDTQSLAVSAAVEGDTYTILRWQVVSTVQWQTEDSLPVWDGSGSI